MTTFALTVTKQAMSMKQLKPVDVGVVSSLDEIPPNIQGFIDKELGNNVCSSKILEVDNNSPVWFFYLSKKFNT